MTSVTFTPDIGGDNVTIDDTDSPSTGLANGGHRTRFMIALQQMVKVAQWVKGTSTTVLGYRDAAATSAGQAQTYAAAAQAAAGVPALAGKAGKFLQVNPAANGVQWGDPKDWTADIEAAIKAHLPATIISIHSGSVASIPPTWKLCDGTNGTIDLRDKFVLGAGTGGPAVGATGGAKTVALTAAQMPTHNHGVTDPGHAHGVYDPGHAHGVNDPGHNHGITAANSGGNSPAQVNSSFTTGPYGTMGTNGAGTGISIQGSGTGIGINSSATGITTQNAGSGQAHENMPPYYALCFIQKVWP